MPTQKQKPQGPLTAAQLICHIRQAVGLSQDALGEAAHFSQGHISEWESGKHEPLLPTVNRLVAACGFAVGDVWFTGAGWYVVTRKT